MSEPSAIHAAAMGGEGASSAQVRPLFWSVQRELWENRFVSIGPLVVASVVVFASVGTILVTWGRRASLLDGPAGAKSLASMVTHLSMAPAPIMFASFLIGMYYCLDALYGERRDRSVLFWKSLPVSDRTTVLSKAAIPFVVLPLLAFVLSIATQMIMLTAATLVLAVRGATIAPVWHELHFFQGLVIAAYGLTVHALWFAPIYGWFLVVSAWARRAPFLWAFLPLLAISAVERIALNSWSFMQMLQYRMTGGMHAAFTLRKRDGDIRLLEQLDPLSFLATPGLWGGLAFAALCLIAAVHLRRRGEPI